MQRIEIVGQLAGFAHAVAVGQMSPSDLASALRALLGRLEGMLGHPDARTGPAGAPAGAQGGTRRQEAPVGAPGGAQGAQQGLVLAPGAPEGAPGHHPGAQGPSEALARAMGGALALPGVETELSPTADRTARVNGAADRLFAFWVRETGRSLATTRKTPERVTKIRARLRDGYTEQDIRRAIANVAADDFLNGSEKGKRYDDITLICRDGSHLERYRDMGDADPSASEADAAALSLDEDRERRRTALKRKAAKAMKEGRHDEYQKLQDKLRQFDAST